MAKETRSNVCKYSANNKQENSSRCLVQEGQKQCSKILKGKFATNLNTLQAAHLTIIFHDVIKGEVLMIIVLVISSMVMVL